MEKTKIEPKISEIVENRVRDREKMMRASQDIDRLRKKASVGWDSVKIIRHMRDLRK